MIPIDRLEELRKQVRDDFLSQEFFCNGCGNKMLLTSQKRQNFLMAEKKHRKIYCTVGCVYRNQKKWSFLELELLKGMIKAGYTPKEISQNLKNKSLKQITQKMGNLKNYA